MNNYLDENEIVEIAERLAETIIPFSGMFYYIENMDEKGAAFVYERACDLGYAPHADDAYKIMGKMQSIFNTW